MTKSFLPRLKDIQANTNRKSKDQTYISKKQTEFSRLYDISEEKKNQDLELPEYIAVSPSKKRRNDDDDDKDFDIPDLDLDDEEEKEYKETDVDLDDPDWEWEKEEEDKDDDDDEFEKKTKTKKRNYLHYPRTTAAAIRFGISTFALTVLVWAYNMGKKT